MAETLQILILEDNPADAELIQFELQEAGLSFTAKVAYSADSATRFRRNPPPSSDPSRQGVPIDSATPDRSVATLVF